MLRAGVRVASDVLRGKTMKQALKNRVPPLAGDLVREEPWRFPLRFPAAYLINTAHSGTAGEHCVGVFLEDSRHAEYFYFYGTAPLESVYQRL